MNFRIPRSVHSFFYQTKFGPLLIILWIVTLWAGYIGFEQSGVSGDFYDKLYTTLKLVVGGYPSEPIDESPLLNLSRFLSYFLMFATFLVAIQTLFYEGLRRWWRAYRGGHTIICGMGSIGIQYIRSYLEADESPFIVIESNPFHPQIRSFQLEGVHILTGDATDPRMLEMAGVKKAKNLIAVTGSDTKNAVIASLCEMMRMDNPQKFICSVHIVNPLLCNLLQAKWYRKRITRSTDDNDSSAVKLEAFNIYQLAGMMLLEDNPPFANAGDPEKEVHILVIGGGKLGEAIIQRMVHVWQVTPGVSEGRRYKVTLADRRATELTKKFLELYPIIGKFCEIIPVDIDIGTTDFFSRSFFVDDNKRCFFTSIYVCLYDYENGLYIALEIDEMLQTIPGDERPDIILRTLYDEGMSQLLGKTIPNEKIMQKIRIFPLIDRVCSPEFTENGTLIEVLAHASHENYMKTCLENGEMTQHVLPFNQLDPKYKRSNRNQALCYTTVLDKFGYAIRNISRWDEEEPVPFSPEELEEMAETEHIRWWEEKKSFGITDHPDFVPYSQLSEAAKDKDRNIYKNLNIILARVNMKVVRKK